MGVKEHDDRGEVSTAVLKWFSLGSGIRECVPRGRPRSSRFGFGKYKGATVLEVASTRRDIDYVYWYISNVEFEFPKDLAIFLDILDLSGRRFDCRRYVKGVAGFSIVAEQFEPEKQAAWLKIVQSFEVFQDNFFLQEDPLVIARDSGLDVDAACKLLLLSIDKIPTDESDSSEYTASDGSEDDSDNDSSADEMVDSVPIADQLLHECDRNIDDILRETLGDMFPAYLAESVRHKTATDSVVRAMEEAREMRDSGSALAHVISVAAGICGASEATDSDSDDDESDEFYSSPEEHAAAAISEEQKKYIARFLAAHPRLDSWSSPEISKPSPLFSGSGLDPANPESWLLLKAFVCSPTQQLAHTGVDRLPCTNCGTGGSDPFHGDITITAELQTRRVRGIGSDICLVGFRCICNRCARKRSATRKAHAAARAAGADPGRLTELAAAVKNAPSGRFTTYDADILVLLAQRHPFLYMWVPAFVTHRSAVTMELLAILMCDILQMIPSFVFLHGSNFAFLVQVLDQNIYWVPRRRVYVTGSASVLSLDYKCAAFLCPWRKIDQFISPERNHPGTFRSCTGDSDDTFYFSAHPVIYSTTQR
jgi:hypothetical protein